jgi:hypothetical protein
LAIKEQAVITMTQRSKSSSPTDFADGHTPGSPSDVLGNARSFGLGHEATFYPNAVYALGELPCSGAQAASCNRRQLADGIIISTGSPNGQASCLRSLNRKGRALMQIRTHL